MASPTFLGEGSTPRVTDTRWRIFQKILGATIDGGGAPSGSGFLVVYDNQAALPAAPADPAKVWFASFRDGTAGHVWDNVNLVWL